MLAYDSVEKLVERVNSALQLFFIFSVTFFLPSNKNPHHMLARQESRPVTLWKFYLGHPLIISQVGVTRR